MLWGDTNSTDLPTTSSSPLAAELSAGAGGLAWCIGCCGVVVVSTQRLCFASLCFASCFKLESEEIENVLLEAVLGAPKGFSIVPTVPRFTADNLCLLALRSKTKSQSSNPGTIEPPETNRNLLWDPPGVTVQPLPNRALAPGLVSPLAGRVAPSA